MNQLDLGSNAAHEQTERDTAALLAILSARLGEPVDHADLRDARTRLEYTRQYQPGRVLDDERSKWQRIVRELGKLGHDVSTEPLEPDVDDVAPEPAAPEPDEPELDAATVARLRADGVEVTIDGDEPASTPSQLAQLDRFELANLRQSGLTDATIIANGFATWRAQAIDKALGAKVSKAPKIDPANPSKQTYAAATIGLAIPIIRPGETEPYAHRIRLRFPRAKSELNESTGKYELEYEDDGRLKQTKYEAPRTPPGMAYAPPLLFVPAEVRASGLLRDPSVPLLIVEGEKKSVLLAQLGYTVIGLCGIDAAHDVPYRREQEAAYRREQEAAGKPVGKKLKSRPEWFRFHAEILNHVVFTDRDVVVFFDASDKPSPREPDAAQRIGDIALGCGAKSARFCTPPTITPKGPKGPDDLAVHAALGGREHDLTRDCAEVLDLEAGRRAIAACIDGAEVLERGGGEQRNGKLFEFRPTPKARARARANPNVPTGDRVSDAQIIKLGTLPPGVDPRTDLAQAHRLVAFHGWRLRHCAELGWLCFDGTCWVQDDKSAKACAIETAELCVRAAKQALNEVDKRDKEERAHAEAAYDAAVKTQSKHAINAAVELAIALAPIKTTDAVWDKHPDLFVCRNGTLDLRTGELRAHDAEDLITQCANVEYDPTATAPLWQATLERFLPDAEVRAFLQRYFGSALSGHRDQVLPVLHGKGANGKSTIVETLRHVLGDYASTCGTDTLLATAQDRGTENDIARLRAARFVTSSESGEHRSLDEARIKKLTGDDMLPCRFLFKEHFEYLPAFKIVMLTNHVPRVKGTDHAIWRRVLLVPFNVTIPDDEIDIEFSKRLQTEAAGILQWLAAGYADWKRVGLRPPPQVATATSEWRNAENAVRAFIGECCQIGATLKATSGALFTAYEAWCKQENQRALAKSMFGRRVGELGKELGFEKDRGDDHFWAGLGLRASAGANWPDFVD